MRLNSNGIICLQRKSQDQTTFKLCPGYCSLLLLRSTVREKAMQKKRYKKKRLGEDKSLSEFKGADKVAEKPAALYWDNWNRSMRGSPHMWKSPPWENPNSFER